MLQECRVVTKLSTSFYSSFFYFGGEYKELILNYLNIASYDLLDLIVPTKFPDCKE